VAAGVRRIEALTGAAAVAFLQDREAVISGATSALGVPAADLPQAIEKLQALGHEITWGCDLGAPEERAITADEVVPVFVTNFPKECKPFYMKEDEEDPRTYACADLLAPAGFGEIIGGSEREVDLGKMLARIKEQGLCTEAYEWYLDLRRYGSVPHSGFGLGIERVVKFLCDLEHIRDAIPFPRTVSRAYP